MNNDMIFIVVEIPYYVKRHNIQDYLTGLLDVFLPGGERWTKCTNVQYICMDESF